MRNVFPLCVALFLSFGWIRPEPIVPIGLEDEQGTDNFVPLPEGFHYNYNYKPFGLRPPESSPEQDPTLSQREADLRALLVLMRLRGRRNQDQTLLDLILGSKVKRDKGIMLDVGDFVINGDPQSLSGRGGGGGLVHSKYGGGGSEASGSPSGPRESQSMSSGGKGRVGGMMRNSG